MGEIIYTKQLPAKITTHPTYLSFLLPFYLLVMLSMYKVQKCHTFFWSCTLSPFKNIFIFKVYLHHIRYNIAVRNHLCCTECINGAEHLGENTNNFKNSFSNKCCHRSVSIWSKNFRWPRFENLFDQCHFWAEPWTTWMEHMYWW